MSERRTESAWEAVYRLVRRIPRGRVMSYGQIADLLERPLSARAVGWAMHQCPPGLPWHRVVNAAGGCSTDKLAAHPGLQRALLEAEGVHFGKNGRLDVARYGWNPRRSARKAAPGAPRGSGRRKPEGNGSTVKAGQRRRIT